MLADAGLAIPALTVGGIIGFVVLYVLLMPENAEKLAGWGSGLLSFISQAYDQRSVKHRVQGSVNEACVELAADIPPGIIEGQLKIKWASAKDARALVNEGVVLVVLRPARFLEDNIVSALMAYLPHAVTPIARPYVDRPTMQGIHLTLARNVLAQQNMPAGARQSFRDQYVSPLARKDPTLDVAFMHADRIDLQGWLTRVMLVEYKFLAEDLLPADGDADCQEQTAGFRHWLHELAAREPGERGSLEYQSRYIHTAVVFVAIRGRIVEEGLRPYRRRVKKLIYSTKCDSVYVIARDDNIPAVEALADELRTDALIHEEFRCKYRLRRDFRKRTGLNRERAICVCLRRRQGGPPDFPRQDDGDDDVDLQHVLTVGTDEPSRPVKEAETSVGQRKTLETEVPERRR